MRLSKILLSTLLLSVLFCSAVLAQDAGQVLRLSVGYRTLKNSVSMTDEKRKVVEDLETRARSASGERKYGEALRLLSHGIALMRNQPWTPVAELNAGLQLKADRLIVDPGQKIDLSLVQMFKPEAPVSGRLDGALSVAITKNGTQETLSELQALAGVPGDLGNVSPIKVAIPDLSDGIYQFVLKLRAETGEDIYKSINFRLERGINEQAETLGRRIATVKSDLQKKGLNDLLAALPAVEYAVSMIQLINRGALPIERTDIKTSISDAAARLDMIAKGKNPLLEIRGDTHWAYRSNIDETLQPYRFYLPQNYDPAKRWPLIIALHGMGGDENSFFAAYNNGVIKRMAEARGYLVACPKGRAPTSMYMGSAQQDVLDVITLMKRQFSIDEDRVYLMGHSMGGYGTWSVAVNHPEIFAAIAPISGGGNPLVMSRLRNAAHIPQIVVHGDKDPTVPVDESRKMVKLARELGIEIKYLEIPGGNHSNIVVPALKEIFDWFDTHKRKPGRSGANAQ